MSNVQKTLVFSLCAFLYAQDETKTKKRKVYRTQTGAIIEAPRPLFERSVKKDKAEPRIKPDKSKALARTKKIETTYLYCAVCTKIPQCMKNKLLKK